MPRKIAVYPGSFDPITFGHLDIINRSLRIFDQVIVAVGKNTGKNGLFGIDERVNLIRQVMKRAWPKNLRRRKRIRTPLP